MAAPARKTPEPRWHRRFESARTFGQDLDPIGLNLDALTAAAAWRRRPEQTADYAFRRLLTAFRLAERLTFPVEVSAQPPGHVVTRYTIHEAERTAREVALAIAEAPGKVDALLYRMLAEHGHRRELTVFLDDEFLGTGEPTAGPLLTKALEALARSSASDARLHVVTQRQARLDVGTDRETRVWLATSYETDYVGWVFDQVAKLEVSAVPGLDLFNVAEELGDLGRSDESAVQSHLTRLLMHLLKWRYQPEHRSGSWRGTIAEARKRILQKIAQSPGMKPKLPAWFAETYADARELAHYETGLPLDTFPETAPFSLEQALDQDFLPDNRPPDEE